jgi:hypothetical protein
MVRRKSDFAEFGTEYTYVEIYIYVQHSPVEMQTPTRWKLIGRSMTDQPPVLSLSSILPSPSSQCAFIPVRKNSPRF